jgi:cell division protein FtsB
VNKLGEMASGLRFGGFTIFLVVIVVAGVAILSPSISTFVQQRREIHDVEKSLQESRDAVDKAQTDRKKWQDPAFIRSQARDRLFYVLPGESQLGIIDDITLPPEHQHAASPELTQIDQDWAKALISSTIRAGNPEKEETKK